MNRKYVFYTILTIFLMAARPSFSMHTLVLRGAQLLSAGFCVGKGAKEAYEYNKSFKEDLKILSQMRQSVFFVRNWAQAEIDKLNKSDNIPELKFHSQGYWASCGKNNIMMEKNWKFIVPLLKNKISKENRTIARNSMILRHEVCHIINNDVQNKMYALAWMPLAVQGVCSTASYGFNKLRNIQPPKNVYNTVLRSSLALGSIPVKIGLSYLGMMNYSRHQEKRADRYACEHAESRLGLEEFRKFFEGITIEVEKKLSSSPEIAEKFWGIYPGHRIAYCMYNTEHPYPTDRAAMVQRYIDKWDAEHSNK